MILQKRILLDLQVVILGLQALLDGEVLRGLKVFLGWWVVLDLDIIQGRLLLIQVLFYHIFPDFNGELFMEIPMIQVLIYITQVVIILHLILFKIILIIRVVQIRYLLILPMFLQI